MTKADLRTGMIVTLRNGGEYMVYRNYVTTWTNKYRFGVDCIVNTMREGSWQDLSNDFTDDLTSKIDCKWDIIKVEEAPHPFAFISPDYERNERMVLWKRDTVRKYTFKQLKEILGHDFELVEED